MPETNSTETFTISNLNALKNNLSYNKFSTDGSRDTYLQFQPINRRNTDEGTYLDYINSLKAETEVTDLVGTVLNGQGIGLDSDNNLVSSFNTRTSLAGRVLTATGVINDTPLGQIGNLELLKILKNKVIFNAQRETVGRVNIDPVNAIRGGDIIRPDYSITIGYDTLGKIGKTFTDLTGVTLPIRYLSDEASIWEPGNNQALIKNTGRGQTRALFDNLKATIEYANKAGINTYMPDYSDDRIKNGDLGDTQTYLDSIDRDFIGMDKGTDSYDEIFDAQDSLLSKTKNIFKNEYLPVKYPEFINGEFINVNGPQFTTNTVDGKMSRGSGVKSAQGLTGADKNVFGRVFTKDNQYNKVRNLQKHKGLAYKDSADDSVLDSNGFVRVSPYSGDANETSNGPKNMKKFMLSLENLAWDGGSFNELPLSEKGPGDPINGTRGRIMWFPPYEISFTDTTSVNWESTNFIGRGEPIYTYNNTNREGVLQFKMIIDYPSYIEDLKGQPNDFFHSIASGTQVVDFTKFKNLSIEEMRNLELGTVVRPQQIMDTGGNEPEEFTVYYRNDETTFDSAYSTNDFFDNTFTDGLNTMLTDECPSCKVIIKATHSFDELESVAIDRANNFKAVLKDKLISAASIEVANGLIGVSGCSGEFPEDSECKSSARKVTVSFSYDALRNDKNEELKKPILNETDENSNRDVTNDIKKRFINESLYFKKLSEEDPIAYKSLNDKIKHFHPAFHSITPEGFNSRLNFLQQCTRQGPTQNSDKADNLAFGKPPVCILRVGDLYNTKIAINTLNLSFDPLVWDLNPEGVGVQPMIVTVDLGFHFLGGSSLRGPINKLQNAVSFNFFANTEIYDSRADSIVNGEYKSTPPKTKDDEGVSDDEAKENKVEKPTPPPIDEPARVNELYDPEAPWSLKGLMSNLILTVNSAVSNSESHQVNFTVTRKVGYEKEMLFPTEFKTTILITDNYDKENEDGDVGLEQQKGGKFQLSQSDIVDGNQKSVTLNKLQYGYIKSNTSVTLTIESGGFSITEILEII